MTDAQAHEFNSATCPAHVPGCDCPDAEGWTCNPYFNPDGCWDAEHAARGYRPVRMTDTQAHEIARLAVAWADAQNDWTAVYEGRNRRQSPRVPLRAPSEVLLTTAARRTRTTEDALLAACNAISPEECP